MHLTLTVIAKNRNVHTVYLSCTFPLSQQITIFSDWCLSDRCPHKRSLFNIYFLDLRFLHKKEKDIIATVNETDGWRADVHLKTRYLFYVYSPSG